MNPPCQQCKFYTTHFLGKPTCSRVSNVSVKSKQNVPFRVPQAYQICKGYFFEHAKSDLFRTSDDALSDSTFPFEEE